MENLRRYAAALAVMLGILPVYGGSRMSFSHITIENGLSSNTIQCIYQDSEGLMWFGTNDGLSVYDTYMIRTWRNIPGDPTSIGNNSIYSIFEDRDKTLWIGTERGLFTYNRRNSTFALAMEDTDLASAHIRSIAQDTTGNIWLATLGNGIFRIDSDTGRIRNWRHDILDSGSIGSDYCPKVLADAMGNVWCLTSGKYLYRHEHETDSFMPILIQDVIKGKTAKNAFTMCLDWEGDLWIGGWDSGIFHYDKESGIFTNHMTNSRGPLLKGRIHTLAEPEPGRLLIGSDAGLTDLSYDTGRFSTTSYGDASDNGLSDDFVHDIFLDREGGLWIATYFGGVNYMNPNSSSFILEKCSVGASKGRVISKFCENGDGKIWIGTDDGGVFLYDPAKKQSVQVAIDPDIPNLNIHALLKDGEYLWTGTYSNGLYRMEIRSGKVEHFPTFSEKDSINQSVYSLYKDQTGRLWIGTKTGIYVWNAEKGFTLMKRLGFHSDIIAICADTKGHIWFASISNGLFCYDPQSQELNAVYSSSGDKIPEEILSMCIHSDQIYLGTAGRGAVRHDISSGKTVRLESPTDNMANLSIFHLINDEDELWMSTNEGLLRYDLTSGKVSIFGRSDGLKTDVFNSNSGIRTADGYIYLGTNDGFNIFKPDNLQKNTTSPGTIFTRCSFPDLMDGDHIVIRKGHDPFTIGFSALSYRAPQKNRYRYMLEGHEDTWTETSWDCNTVSFSDLACGSYIFRVYSCNNDGIWGEPISAEITVKPYWYNCTAAIVIYIALGLLFLMGIATTFITYTMQKKKSRAEKIKYVKEKTRIETELQFFTNLAHEIRTPVMLINAPANEIAGMKDLPQKVQDNIALIKKSSDKLSSLTNEILNFRKSSSDMEISPKPIIQLTRQIADDFMPVTTAQGITLNFVDNTEGKAIADINTEAWNKIINNLLTNAIKFTKDLIEIRADIINDTLYIKVYDNGTGIPQHEIKKVFQAFWHYDKTARRPSPGFGLGLSITSMLAHKMGMKLNVTREVDKFTEFTIRIPLSGKEAAEEEFMEETVVNESLSEVKPDTTQGDGMNMKAKNIVTIMIVDDDDDLRLYLASILSESYKVLTASDGEEAMDMLKSGQLPDLIISDIMMPRLNGIELCNTIRKDINLCHIPIILLSANSDIEIRKQSAQNGSDIYIDKPVDIAYLKTQIMNLLERRQMLWDSFSKRPYLSLQNIAEDLADKDLIKRFNDIVTKNMSNPDLSVPDLAVQLGMSRSHMCRKIKDITGLSPSGYLKTVRLRKAAELLVQGNHQINEICWMVGFNTPSYFSKCFNQEFGINPTEFISRNRHDISDEKEGL